MSSVGHAGTQLSSVFLELDDAGNVLVEIPIKVTTRKFSFTEHLDLWRQLWEEHNKIREGMKLPPLSLDDAYQLALAHVRAEKEQGDV